MFCNESLRLCAVQDDTYTFPYVMVCVFDGYGCGHEEETTCIASAHEGSYVMFNGNEVPGAVVDSKVGDVGLHSGLLYMC